MNGLQNQQEGQLGVYRNGRVELVADAAWADGTEVLVWAAPTVSAQDGVISGDVIIAGFGLGGRFVADLLETSDIPYVVVERNSQTVETQRNLGRRVIEGDVSESSTLHEAGVESAAALALTIPDEQAVLRATELARQLNRDVYIIARTTHASCGMKAKQLGANEVINAEQLAAMLFHEKLRAKIASGGFANQRTRA